MVGVLALGAAGVFAAQQMGGSDESGGAATPEELATSFMTALESEDVLGMIDVLSPAERDVFRQPSIDVVAELTRLEVLSADADLAAIRGLDVVLEAEDVEVTGTNVDDIVNVRMQADAEVTLDGAELPVGDLITDNMGADMVDEMRSQRETTSESFDLSMTAVQEDGRWYFSLFHTAAETIRDDVDPSLDIPLEGVGAVGGDSPEAAVEQLLDSVEGLDLELLIQTLHPGDAAALQRYAPLFLSDAQSVLDEIPLEWSITTREYRVEGDGSSRTVFIDALGIEGTIDGEPFSVTIEGDCVTAEMAGERVEQCADDSAQTEVLDEILGELPAVEEFVTAVQEAFSDIEPIGLELREYDGSWYVSPISTVSEATLAFLRALDRAEIDRLIELGQGAFEETIGDIGELSDLASGDLDDVLEGADPMTDDSFTDTFEETFEEPADTATDPFGDDSETVEVPISTTVPMGDDGATDTFEETAAAIDWEECYSELDTAAAKACFDGYVASGDIDEFMVPIALRFPECGFEASWTRELYSMTDEQFIATIEAAAPCFQALVDAGTISDFEVPTEITNLTCYEGRNWYNTFDDPEYDDRYWACVDQLWAEAAAG